MNVGRLSAAGADARNAAASNRPATKRQPRILIVEDERIISLDLSDQLSRLGYEVAGIATSGDAALRHIANDAPDLVLMDVQIEGTIDGIETARRIPAELMIPVIYLTAHADDNLLQRARFTKPYGYVIKPVSGRELHAMLQMALERRANDLALKESQQRLQMALAASELGAWEIEQESGHILYRDHAGWSQESAPRVLAEQFRDLLATIHEEDRAAVQAAFDRVSLSNEMCEIEFRRVDAAGTTRWFRIVGRAVYVGNDRRRRIVGVARDVTGARQAAQERRDSDQNYRDLISTIKGVIWEIDRTTNRLTYVSDSVTNVLGYSAEEWLSDPTFWETHIHPDDLADAVARYQAATRAGGSYECTYRMIAQSGKVVWIHEVVAAIAGSGERPIMRGVMVDISNVKKAERDLEATALRLAESEKQLSAVLDTAPIGIVTVGGDMRIESFNLEAERIFGYSAAEMVGHTLDRLLPDRVSDRHRQHMANYLADGPSSRSMGDWRTIRGKCADGRVIPLAINISKMTIGGKSSMTAVLRDMSLVQQQEEEMHRLLKDREFAVSRAEAANKAKSSFLAVMSHELRTPLNAIIGFSEVMQRELLGPIGTAYQEYVADIHRSGDLLLRIINSILDLSRIESGKLELRIERMTLADIWADIGSTLSGAAAVKGVTLDVREGAASRPFYADRQASSHILMNLVTNAIKFTPAGGLVEVGEDTAYGAAGVTIYVRDTGRGIPQERLKDVVKPFVQVSDSHARDTGGVGLGLAICKSLADAMSAQMDIESELGRGTVIRVIFPMLIPTDRRSAAR
ncbi:MAG TPA: PAS domain S-box protein [Dongiaceae bacterium]|nr:PAS domain S-box protein [Dongiaceae bacterium]